MQFFNLVIKTSLTCQPLVQICLTFNEPICEGSRLFGASGSVEDVSSCMLPQWPFYFYFFVILTFALQNYPDECHSDRFNMEKTIAAPHLLAHFCRVQTLVNANRTKFVSRCIQRTSIRPKVLRVNAGDFMNAAACCTCRVKCSICLSTLTDYSYRGHKLPLLNDILTLLIIDSSLCVVLMRCTDLLFIVVLLLIRRDWDTLKTIKCS